MGNVEVAYSTKRAFYSSSAICTSPIKRLVSPPPPNFSVILALCFPLGITVVPREIKDCLCKTRSIMEDVKMANSPF